MSDQNPFKAPVSTEEAVPSGPVTAKTRELLGQASPWLRFLFVLGWIAVGAGALAVVGITIFGFVSGTQAATLISAAIAILVLVVISYFPLRILGRLTKGARKYKTDGEAAGLEMVASGVRGLARFYGIFTIVMLAVYAVMGVSMFFFHTGI